MDLVQIASRLAARFSGPGNVSVVEQSTNYPDYPGSIYLYSVLMDGEEYEVEVGLYGKQQKETEALGAWLLDPDTHERTEADLIRPARRCYQ